MKKSEIYTLALVAVVNSRDFSVLDKLDVVKQLMDDRSVAEWSEKQEEKKAQEEANA